MLIYFYVYMILLSLLLALRKGNQMIDILFVFKTLIIWSVLSRFYGLQIDMLTYSNILSYDFEQFLNFYYLREPVYWLGSKLIYDIVENEVFVFIIIDTILIFIFCFFSYKLKVRAYFILVFMLFFSNMMGFLNVYRQFIASVLLFLSFLSIHNGYFKSRFLYALSFFTHNVSGVFLPLLLLNNKFNQSLKFWFGFVISLILMIILSTSKSVGETGETSPILFMLVSMVVFVVFVYLSDFKVSRNNVFLYYLNLYCITISSISTFLLSNVAAKRISMLVLVFMLYSIYVTIEKIEVENKFFLRFLFILIAVLPTFIFPSALNMLLLNS